MPSVEFDLETSVAPDNVRAALIDFSRHRPEIWPGISPSFYHVYDVGESSADIREGTKAPGGAVWAKEHYDWSDPQTVRWTVRESNFCEPGSYVAATITPRDGGGSNVHIEWNRTPSGVKGRLLVRMILMSKGKPVAASLRKGLAKLEAAAA